MELAVNAIMLPCSRSAIRPWPSRRQPTQRLLKQLPGHSDDRISRQPLTLAPLDSEGKFQIDDLIADTYSVTIDPPEPVPGEPGAAQAKPTVEIPARYREAKSSTFQADVKPGSNTFEFKMTK